MGKNAITCDNRTVTAQPVSSQADLGRRVAQAREEVSLTQGELAAAIGLDRTSVVKLEAGSRKVSATELVAIARVLDRPIDWFVYESPPAVVSRRRDPSVAGHSRSLDARVEWVSRDVAFLRDQGILPAVPRPAFVVPADLQSAERVASEARALMGVGDGPIHDLQRYCERVGLLAFALDLGENGGDAAYVEVQDLGVALINASADPGRRRFNLAHELAHHLVGDAYAPETAVSPGDETERLLNAVAVHLLMPRTAVRQLWEERASEDRRLAAVAITARFRTSWSATCSHLRNLGLVDATERDDLANAPPKKGDFLEVGEWWMPELEAPSVPPEYARRVVGSYRSGKLTAARAVELLWGTVSEGDLPELDEIPLNGLRREFEAFP